MKHVFKCIQFPKHVSMFRLSTLMNIGNAITTIDIKTQSITEVKKNINKSIVEQKVRFRHIVQPIHHV